MMRQCQLEQLDDLRAAINTMETNARAAERQAGQDTPIATSKVNDVLYTVEVDDRANSLDIRATLGRWIASRSAVPWVRRPQTGVIDFAEDLAW